ncbi:DUF4625 domain-containing protein [Spirosoma aerolatum]|uniref:DUF4625 domain-containing protein n=1 Tax=Spirosoma aerolatum TaxID=1211326 RepID=UPI0009ABC4A9|nr:DUF4625 domain-containing protein [Spirosoma aerolatum]
MKLTKFPFLAIALSASVLFSCEKEEPADLVKPEVKTFELGTSNSQQAYAGKDIHIASELVAVNTISNIQVKITQKSNVTYASKWQKDTTYTGVYANVKNTTFHEHIIIPVTAGTGMYDFTMLVKDTKGGVTEVKKDLEILSLSDFTPPVITVTAAPANGATFKKGDVISIKGTVTEDKGIGIVYVGLLREDQKISDTSLNSTNSISLALGYDFKTPTMAYPFDANITVGAAKDMFKDITGTNAWQSGKYYLIVVATNAYGANYVVSPHYPITINY